jgi:uncharacterized protein (DUF4415 family)
MSNTSKTDWSRIDAMKDEDIDTSDIPPLSEDFWVNAQLRLPKDIVTVKVEIDTETFAWFQSQGETAQEQMSVALKIYAQANKAFGSSITKAGYVPKQN